MVKNPSAMQETGLIPVSERSAGEGIGYPTPVFLPGELHGQKPLVDYSPWGCKESDMTERLSLSLSTRASLVSQMVKNPPAMRETWVRSLGWEDPLEEGMATHSSILAWRIPMDKGTWWATVHGNSKSQKQLSD